MEKLISQGICKYCDKVFKKAGISRHLNTHLADIAPKAKTASYHLRVEAGPYFLNLLMDGDEPMESLDEFLRSIWLECCGHLSAFMYMGRRGEMNMSTKIRRAMVPGEKLIYHYDFGSTTELEIKAINVYPFPTREGIELLSRNEPLEIWCDTCKKKPAVEICVIHWDEDNVFCKTCVKKHAKTCEDAADYSLLPIVNSPRFGVCGYDGGRIDTERDGVFSKK